MAALNHCHSSYRSWVHLREAQTAGLIVPLGKRPYFTSDNLKLTPVDGKIHMSTGSSHLDFLHYGFWLGPKFLTGMYYKVVQLRLVDYKQSLIRQGFSRAVPLLMETVRVTMDLKIAFFRGIVATGRPYQDKDNKQSRGFGCGKITFVTIGYANGKYLDLVLSGHHPVGSLICIEG